MNPIVNMLKKTTKDFVKGETELFRSEQNSRDGLIVPELIFKYGDKKSHIRKFPQVLPWLIPAVIGRFVGYRSLKKNPADPQKIASSQLLEEVEALAGKCGCHAVGYAEVPARFIFKGKEILTSHAIVLSMSMNKKRMIEAPKMKAGREVWRIYDRLGRASNKVAKFLRRNGFSAQGGAALGGDVNYPLLAQSAGLGWIGKHGLLISPETGPSQRLAAVFTSIENLPVLGKNQHSWIGDVCSKCNKCVKACPSEAIFEEKPVLEDGGPRHIDYRKCIVPFTKSMGCSICIKACTFFSGDFNKIHRTLTK